MASAGTRQRPLALPGAVVVAETLGAKVLHGWLQNRHQTLYPLTVNLRTMDASTGALLAQMMAVALLAGAAPEPAQAEAAASWLDAAGAGKPTKAVLHAALEQPPPLSRLLHEIQQAGAAAYAYVAALAAGSRDPAAQLFLDYLAARLGLPASVVRSANRRHRR